MKTARWIIAAGIASLVLPAAGQQKSAPAARTNGEVPSAQSIKRLADGHPDLNGFWASGTGPDTPVGGFGPPDPDFRPGGNYAPARHAVPNMPPHMPQSILKDQGR